MDFLISVRPVDEADTIYIVLVVVLLHTVFKSIQVVWEWLKVAMWTKHTALKETSGLKIDTIVIVVLDIQERVTHTVFPTQFINTSKILCLGVDVKRLVRYIDSLVAE
jgi:hypothetical protein